MTVIALTHEIGTLGRELATKLSARLNIDFADRHFLGIRIADRLALDKRWQQKPGPAPGERPRRVDVDPKALARAAADEILELAAFGNILLRGWGAASLLRCYPDVVRVRLYAPMSFRLEVIGDRGDAPDPEALRQLIEHDDACLASNLEPVLGPDWRSGQFYHCMIGAHLQSVDQSVEQIVDLIGGGAKADNAYIDRY